MDRYYKEIDQHVIPHITQNTNWDCGLACVAMILHGMNMATSLEDLIKQCAIESIWTIDLAFLLHNYTQTFTFYTSYIGSRKEYQNDKFYEEKFDQDQPRVNHLFSIAKRSSVQVVRMVLPLDDFKRFLDCQDFAVILLVNAQFLNCNVCENRHGFAFDACGHLDILSANDNDYLGHFVVLIGYDPRNDMFIYRDPATDDSYCVISAKDLDHARRAEGTDHDCIVIQLR